MRTQQAIATKPKIKDDKNTKEKVEQRNMTEERNIKIGNTYGVLQKDDQEPISEEKKLSLITKIDKDKKKGIEGR